MCYQFFIYFHVIFWLCLLAENQIFSAKRTIASEININDKITKTNIEGEFFGVSTAAGCLEKCSQNDNCLTFFYHPVDHFCQTHSVVFSTNSAWEDRPGTVYYHRIHPERCNPLDYIYHPRLKFCYRIVTEEPVTWEEARQTCQQDGGDLIVFDTIDKYNHINQTLHANTYVNTKEFNFCLSIGAQKIGNDWYWIDNSLLLPSSPLWHPNDNSTSTGDNTARLCSLFNFHIQQKRSRRTAKYICES